MTLPTQAPGRENSEGAQDDSSGDTRLLDTITAASVCWLGAWVGVGWGGRGVEGRAFFSHPPFPEVPSPSLAACSQQQAGLRLSKKLRSCAGLQPSG